MWFAILAKDHPASLVGRLAARALHRAGLQAMHGPGRGLLAGSLPVSETDAGDMAGYVGSLIVADFATLAEARAWTEANPYVEAGVYPSVKIYAFTQGVSRLESRPA